ncbi:endopeptidase La [Desulfovibrio mangrovi]|uniref:endopeptidase La n=1 Tax=Desulfovibrio mangrovi TaxID=2976983 RepID=UPI0022452B49|nr:endopeptidase La [Desulfovibrio mangrovi]UZP69212.1 endopeptidase La [Desulfovibrio mangrovi]
MSDDSVTDSLADDMEGALPEFPSELPVLPVRDIVVFNYMILPLFVGREKSVQAVDAALNGSRYLMITTQKDESTEDPKPDDLHQTGTVVMIMRMLKMPDGRLKVLVQGISRAVVKRFISEDPYMIAEVEAVHEPEIDLLTVEQEAMMRAAREQSERILSLRGVATSDIMSVLNSVNDPGRLADLIAANLRMKVNDAQLILECTDPLERLQLVNNQLVKETEVAAMQAKIQNMAREGMDKAQKDYYLREQLKAIRRELGEGESGDDDIEELARMIEKAGLPKDVRKEADKQLRRLASMHPDASEATVVRTYLEWLGELPWKKLSRDRLDIPTAETILNDDHYGLEKVKDRILEYLSVRKLNPKSKGPILCFAGPPGVGKTSLGRSIARALGRKFSRVSLGGMRDEAEIRGHRRTYIGAMPGRIIQIIKQLGTRNPVIMLDEIDKLGSDFRGDPSSALLEVLDPEQNFSFSDHYLNVPFDLSKVMFICTANQLDTIPAPLRDRMEIIQIPGYTLQEKASIARRYLIPRQTEENGLTMDDAVIPDTVITKIIQEYTREAGLRNLEREIGSVCRKLARKKAEGKKGPFKVTLKTLPKLLGIPRYLDEEREKELLPGVAMGLAWTPFGGEILHIEVSTMKGKGKLTLTGQLGDVMKESAQAAMSYARAHAEQLGIDPDFLEKLDIHIHVPAGATPKDGPSAGVTLVSALISALSGKPVNSDLCMTGEITLRGRVMPVGGIKEKILAGVTRGLGHVIIPSQNVKDLEDVPAELLKKIEVHTAERIDDLIPLVFPS